MPEWRGGTPRSASTPIKNALFTKRIQFLPAPSSSLHPMNGETKCARFLGSPGPAEPENLAHLLLPSLHHSNGKNGKATCVGMGGTPRSAPTQSKTHFLRKEFITQNLALVFQLLPAPFSSLHPMNGETKCARFLGSPGPAEPENLAHLLLPSLHHSNGKNGKATCVGMGGTPRSAPTQSKTPFLRKEFITQNLALVFQFLPAPFSSLHPMNGETKCARFLGSPGPAEPENLAHLLLHSLLAPQQRQERQGHMCRNGGKEGTPRSAPTPIKNALFTKRIYHSKSGPDFSIFARSVLLPTPNERRDRMCQVFGLTRPRRARKPGTFAPSFPAPSERQDQMCRNVGNPEIGPDSNQKRHFYEKNLSLKIWPWFFNCCPLPSPPYTQ